MNTLTLAGFWYADALPSGAFVAAAFGRDTIQTQAGSHYGHELQWVRMAPDGLRFAGTGANDAHAWEWDGTGWQDRDGFVAPRAVIYQADGSLYVERTGAWPGSGSMGWRYVDDAGALVPSWTTYANAALHLYEYTTRRDVSIGQGDGGVVAILPGKRVRLDYLFRGVDGSPIFGEVPACFAVTFTRAGNQYAVSWYVAHTALSYTACFVWLTDAELRALPDASAPVPGPVPVPIPVPPPIPEPPPVSIPDYSSLVASLTLPLAPLNAACDVAEKIRAQQGEDAPATQAAEQAANQIKGGCTDTIAAALNAKEGRLDWGELRKDSGQHWTRSDGINLSTDILFHKPTGRLVDVMADRHPTWDVHPPEDVQLLEKWVAPLGAVPPAEPPPTPEPPPVLPPNPPAPDLLAALNAITAQLDGLRSAQRDNFAEVKDRLTAIEQQPVPVPAVVFPQYDGKIPYLGTVTLTPKKA